MQRSARSFILVAVMLALPAADPAQALNAKSWVSNVGSDLNDCSLAHPCATFQGALLQTAAGGDIGVLTPSDYGGSSGSRLNIHQSLAVTNDGAGEATIFVAGGGVIVDAGVGDVVSLRGLVIDGQGGGFEGIALEQASALHVQNCVIRNFQNPSSGFGIIVNLTSGHSQLFVSDSIILNNGTIAGTGGILVEPRGGASANAVLNRVRVENNVVGIVVDGSLATGGGNHVVIRDSVFSGNAADGIFARTVAGQAPAFIVVERTMSARNAGSGIRADGPGATVLMGGSTLTRNGAGVTTLNGGQLISYGDNDNNNNVGPEGSATGMFAPF